MQGSLRLTGGQGWAGAYLEAGSGTYWLEGLALLTPKSCSGAVLC